MFIDVKQLFQAQGQSIAFSHHLDLSDVQLWGTTPFDRPISLDGQVSNHSGIVEIEYDAKLDYHILCGRCLTEPRKTETISFSHVLVLDLNEEDNGDFIVLSGGQLDLDDLATSDILLEMPSVVLCDEDCKGLCPVCGANRNETNCGCVQKQIDPRLEILSEFFKE